MCNQKKILGRITGKVNVGDVNRIKNADLPNCLETGTLRGMKGRLPNRIK